jgi:predicted anti-sigma-YlaC factor YlaD
MSIGFEQNEKNLICSDFEDQLSDYLEGSLGGETHRAMASHALKCPLCHELLNEVKGNLELCRVIAEPAAVLTKLEAGIMARTMPESEMGCDEFEQYLTDYLDGFLPAQLFHRWERHAAVCHSCTDLPGAVVRSIGVCYTFKMEELPLPAGLHERILQSTLGTTEAQTVRASAGARAAEWVRSWLKPISLPLPQLAPLAMVLLFAVLLFSQVVPADASFTTVYQQSLEMAGNTYVQGADTLEAGLSNLNSSIDTNADPNGGKPAESPRESEQKPTYVNGGAAR